MEQLRSEHAQLKRERAELASQVRELEASLNARNEEASALRRMQLELQSRHPDVSRAVEYAVQKEQAVQEERNHKVWIMGWVAGDWESSSCGSLHGGAWYQACGLAAQM